jgi:hypothetical protein
MHFFVLGKRYCCNAAQKSPHNQVHYEFGHVLVRLVILRIHL